MWYIRVGNKWIRGDKVMRTLLWIYFVLTLAGWAYLYYRQWKMRQNLRRIERKVLLLAAELKEIQEYRRNLDMLLHSVLFPNDSVSDISKYWARLNGFEAKKGRLNHKADEITSQEGANGEKEGKEKRESDRMGRRNEEMFSECTQETSQLVRGEAKALLCGRFETNRNIEIWGGGLQKENDAREAQKEERIREVKGKNYDIE